MDVSSCHDPSATERVIINTQHELEDDEVDLVAPEGDTGLVNEDVMISDDEGKGQSFRMFLKVLKSDWKKAHC